MNKIDLIIENIEYAKLVTPQAHKDELLEEALAAARSLRELKPVAWIDEGFIEWENDHSQFWAEKNHGAKLYALEVTK